MAGTDRATKEKWMCTLLNKVESTGFFNYCLGDGKGKSGQGRPPASCAKALSRRRQGVWSCSGAPHLSLVKPCRHAGMEFREGCDSREILECP